jgi:hypothetical protein
MAEDRRTQRARYEADRVDAECLQGPHQLGGAEERSESFPVVGKVREPGGRRRSRSAAKPLNNPNNLLFEIPFDFQWFIVAP